MGKSAFIRATAALTALSISLTSAVPHSSACGDWNLPQDLDDRRQRHGYYSKGHHRANWEQKKIASNHKVAKRRAKNKASRKARRAQRRK